MSNTKDQNQQVDNSKRKTPITRRGIIGAGVVGLAALTAKSAIANTQKPVQPQSGKADPDGRFKDKVVLITGATSGIGKATALAFAKEGAKVFFCGRRTNLGEANAREIQAFGGEATYMQADVRNEDDVRNFINSCVKKYGRIDIAFNNAGIESSPNTIADTSLEDWMNVMNTNATGVFLSMKYELPVMLKQKGELL